MAVSEFEVFVRDAERRLSFAFAAAYGPELGREATADSVAYAWEHWDRLPRDQCDAIVDDRLRAVRRRGAPSQVVPVMR